MTYNWLIGVGAFSVNSLVSDDVGKGLVHQTSVTSVVA